MSTLSHVKKGDSLALIEGEMFMPPRSTRVEVVRRNPKSVVFEHAGKEYRVDLEGMGLLSGYVEPWDEKIHEQRLQAREFAKASRELEEARGPRWDVTRHLQRLKPTDVLDQPGIWGQLRGAQEEYEARVRELVERIEGARKPGSNSL